MSNLLVVDWDYFFPNPLEGASELTEHWGLYDWGHREAEFFIKHLWGTRAVGFEVNGLPLPMVSDWQGFWNRFRFNPDLTEILYSESNARAGNLVDDDGEQFDDVWLFDAHHDCYTKGAKDVEDWRERHLTPEGVMFSCEDWMLIHAMFGSRLHWRWPRWHQQFTEEPPELMEDLQVDMAPDDGLPIDTEFDVVFVCRSGAWVPPWCDDQFYSFLSQSGLEMVQIDDYDMEREWPPENYEAELNARRELLARGGVL